VRSAGQKKLTEGQIAGADKGCRLGTQVGAGKSCRRRRTNYWLASGLFATVKYDFKTRTEGLTLDFHVTESPRGSGLLR